MKKIVISISIMLLLFTSCSVKEKVVYVNGLNQEMTAAINNEFKHDYPLRISQGDVLLISVTALDVEAVAAFNLPLISYNNPGTLAVNTSPNLQYYLVEKDGSITFPIVGRIKVENLTTEEATRVVEAEVSKYVNNPGVFLRFLNYQVTVLGEVNGPGRFNLNSQRVSILDAIGLAGDLTIFGLRENVLVVREQNGKLEFGRIDLTSPEMFTSPYYYLQQNDVIYVEPNSNRVVASQNINLYMSILSTITTISAVVFSFLK